MRVNLELFHENLFRPGSFDYILINHPDPWPKKKHKHHRFLNREIVQWLSDLLTDNGIIEVASDHTEYFFTILHNFESTPSLESILPPPFYTRDVIPGRAMSRFEQRERSQGNTVRILKFTRKASTR